MSRAKDFADFTSEPQGDGRMASINISGEARVAELILRYGKEKARESSIARLALHEMLHLLLSDMIEMAAKRANDSHPDAVREEHRVLERLIPILLPKDR